MPMPLSWMMNPNGCRRVTVIAEAPASRLLATHCAIAH
jgi:hypothetical protein